MKPVLFGIDVLGYHVDVLSYLVFNIFLNIVVFVLLGVFFLCRDGVGRGRAFSSMAFIAVTALVGARLAHVVLSYRHYMELGMNPFGFSGGYTMFGGFVLAVPAVIWVCRRLQISTWTFLDAVAPGWALGVFLNKIGCFLNGCCFGRPTYVPWGVVYPDGSIPHYHYYSVELSRQLIASGGVLPYRIHPVQLYESAVGLAGFAFLLWMLYRPRTPGLAFTLFASLYSGSRLLLHFFRATPEHLSASPRTVAVLYTMTFLLALMMFLYRFRAGHMLRKADTNS